MKKILSVLLCAALLTGCGTGTVAEVTASAGETVPVTVPVTASVSAPVITEVEYVSRYTAVTEILLSDSGITVDGGSETDAVYTSNDIVYYENRDTYDSGNPYGEGTDSDKHTAEEAAAHTVVNITAPGAYRISGKLSAGQIRVDLGNDAYEDPDAVVELILDGADITCTVAPAILFQNTYECDGLWSKDTAKAQVDTTTAGANLILEDSSTVNGSYVAKIFKDKDGEKKLWKQDGAIYSYMSLNIFGPGSLELNAANEGLGSELHLTVNSGSITVNSQNDGINTNEDGVSVTTINGGNLTIFAGLGKEGDGIDSNGYLVINGGRVLSCAKPASDAGLDSDLGSYINGGTVIAMGSAMNWAESDSKQVTINLQFAGPQNPGSEILIAAEDGSEIFRFIPTGGTLREFSGLILSDPALKQGETYSICIDGIQMAYTGTDIRRGPGGFGGPRGERPENFDPENMPEGFDPNRKGSRSKRPDGEGRTPPEGFDPEKMPERKERPDGEKRPERPEGGFGGRGPGDTQLSEPSTEFYMNDMVNAFSGITAAQ